MGIEGVSSSCCGTAWPLIRRLYRLAPNPTTSEATVTMPNRGVEYWGGRLKSRTALTVTTNASTRYLRVEEPDGDAPDGGVLNAILGLGYRLWMTQTEVLDNQNSIAWCQHVNQQSDAAETPGARLVDGQAFS